MRDWTRRDVLKTGLGAAAGAVVGANSLAGLDVDSVARALAHAGVMPAAAAAPRERYLLDFGWKFALGHASDPAKDFGFGAGNEFAKTGQFMRVSQKEFDDSSWRQLDLPHDWAVELPFVNAPELRDAGYHPMGRNYPATSIGWYRRTLDIPASDLGRRLFLVFDGVMRDAVVALNGWYLVRNLSGYAPIRIDITDMAEYGQKNYLAVRVDATERAGWFYEGAGIYRHVWLEKTSPVHVADGGTLVAQDVQGGVAFLDITTEIDNDGGAGASVRVAQAVTDAAGRPVGTAASEAVSVPAGTRVTVHQRIRVASPRLWSLETPYLYSLATTLQPLAGGPAHDVYHTSFGIRTVHFDADSGFYLNGKHVELKGTCNHQDHAGVGAALPDRLQSYRVERLKAMSCNAYRTSHNPPTPELLDACDRLGMLVLDETRMFGSAPDALSEIERLIRRDRNHPSIFAWSMANEEFSVQGTARGTRAARTVKRVVQRLDPTRPVTAAMDHWWEPEGYGEVLDVMGYNYLRGHEDGWHAAHPKQPVMGTEVGSTVSTRGIYMNDKEKGYLSAYDVNAPPWASTAEKWLNFWRARKWLAGGFVWTGFDYRGEPTPMDWPCINSHFGILDTCGFPKDNFYYYRAAWGSEPSLHVLPHWNWAGREGQPIDVWVFSNLPRVELFLNGTSQGARDVPKDGHAEWKVAYAPGVIEARAFAGQATTGAPALVAKRETTGPAARVALKPDRTRIAADGEDASVVEVSIVDAQGRLVPTADNVVSFNVSGAGKLIGVGNGDPSCHESDKGSTRSAFNGLCCAIVLAGKAAGELRIEATSPGLAPASVVISCEAAPARPVA
ncbi:MAG TPA: beta-galactosidase GalA [Longimicrobiales bacterium]